MVPLWKIFLTFAKIGSFTIGGGYAMIPLIRDELVRKGWLSEEELPDIIALSQSAPGILAVNMSIFAGFKMRGVKGSVAATLGTVVPSFLIILLIAMFFTEFKENDIVRRIFQAVRPAAVALILVPAVRMAQSGCHEWWTWAIALASLLGVAFLKVSPIWIILVTISVAVFVSLLKQKKS